MSIRFGPLKNAEFADKLPLVLSKNKGMRDISLRVESDFFHAQLDPILSA